jgi:hypothetical protein
MKVKATKKGFYGGKIRKEDDEFTLIKVEKSGERAAITTEQQFSEKWMVKVAGSKRPAQQPMASI